MLNIDLAGTWEAQHIGGTTRIPATVPGTIHHHLSNKTPARWLHFDHLEVDIRCSDNYFHLPPNATRDIEITPSESLTMRELRSGLQIKTLLDTCD